MQSPLSQNFGVGGSRVNWYNTILFQTFQLSAAHPAFNDSSMRLTTDLITSSITDTSGGDQLAQYNVVSNVSSAACACGTITDYRNGLITARFTSGTELCGEGLDGKNRGNEKLKRVWGGVVSLLVEEGRETDKTECLQILHNL